VRPEPPVDLLVPTLAGQVDVELAEGRRKRIRVADGDLDAVGVRDPKLVVERNLRLRDHSLPHAVAHVLQVDARRLDAHRPRPRPQRAHDHAAVGGVRSEVAVRVGEVERGRAQP
jgi:hypothetical protein